MKAVVVGGGSIGSRHLRNLLQLGVANVTVVEPDANARKRLCDSHGVAGFEALAHALDWQPEIAVVATPTHLHAEQAATLMEAGIDAFVEKPLGHSWTSVADLRRFQSNKSVVSLVGCNMRFHPGPAAVKQLLSEDRIGRVLFARIHAGSYLPGWRPQQDYRQSYSARKEQGGGCLLDLIHEIDLASWYLGPIERVYCAAEHVSSLELDVEDCVSMICHHESGARSEIHLDYVQRTYERGCQIVGEHGSIFWDFRQGVVRSYDAATESWSQSEQQAGWEVNQMYIDETEHFLKCVQQRTKTVLSVPEAVHLMRVVEAARRSSESGRLIHTSEVA